MIEDVNDLVNIEGGQDVVDIAFIHSLIAQLRVNSSDDGDGVWIIVLGLFAIFQYEVFLLNPARHIQNIGIEGLNFLNGRSSFYLNVKDFYIMPL